MNGQDFNYGILDIKSPAASCVGFYANVGFNSVYPCVSASCSKSQFSTLQVQQLCGSEK